MVLDEATRDWLAEQCGEFARNLLPLIRRFGSCPRLNWRLLRVAMMAGHELAEWRRLSGNGQMDDFIWMAAYVMHYCRQTNRPLGPLWKLDGLFQEAARHAKSQSSTALDS